MTSTSNPLPPEGVNVRALLPDNSEAIAYWADGAWWVGVPDDPVDARLLGDVVGWQPME